MLILFNILGDRLQYISFYQFYILIEIQFLEVSDEFAFSYAFTPCFLDKQFSFFLVRVVVCIRKLTEDIKGYYFLAEGIIKKRPEFYPPAERGALKHTALNNFSGQ